MIDKNLVFADSDHVDSLFYMQQFAGSSMFFGAYGVGPFASFEGFIYGFKYSAWDSGIFDSSCEFLDEWCRPDF